MFDFQGLVLHHPVEFNASAFTVGKGISPAEKGKGTFSDRVGNNELTSGIETAEILAILGMYPVEFELEMIAFNQLPGLLNSCSSCAAFSALVGFCAETERDRIENNNEIKISFFMVLLFSCLIIRKQKLYQTNHVFPSSGRSPVPYRVG